MRFLVVFCHPSQDSFGAALFNTTCETLKDSGHEIKKINLYEEKFDPILSLDEWNSYLDQTELNINNVKQHVNNLLWAQGLILIFPSWMYGPPALLKGWLERVWLPGVAFEISSSKQNIPKGKLKHIKRFCVITTSGSPRWWLWYIGNPGKSMLFKGYRILFNSFCKFKWLQLYDMNHSTKEDRGKFIKKVSNYFCSIR